MAEINSVPVSIATCWDGSSGKVSHTQATDTDLWPSSVMPPANQTRDLTTSPRHAVVAGEPLWCALEEGSRTTPADMLAKKQRRSSSYHLGTAFAWPVGLLGPDRELPLSQAECYHTFVGFRFHKSRTIVSAKLHAQVSHRHRDATTTTGPKACRPKTSSHRSTDALGSSLEP